MPGKEEGKPKKAIILFYVLKANTKEGLRCGGFWPASPYTFLSRQDALVSRGHQNWLGGQRLRKDTLVYLAEAGGPAQSAQAYHQGSCGK
jgi:hypothetical protein